MKVIDLDQQFLVFAGIRMQEYADGDAATIAFSGPAWNYKKGADGLGTRSKNYDRSALLTLRLSRGSAINSLLSAIFNKDYKSSNGSGIAPFMLKDGQGDTLLEGQESYIESPPDETITATPGPREWKIRIDHLEGDWGGN